MKRSVLYVAIIAACVSYVFGLPAKQRAGENIRLVQVGRITQIDWTHNSVLVRGVALSKAPSDTNYSENRIYISETTAISYQGATIKFPDIQVGDLISATGISMGSGLKAERIQKYRSALRVV